MMKDKKYIKNGKEGYDKKCLEMLENRKKEGIRGRRFERRRLNNTGRYKGRMV